MPNILWYYPFVPRKSQAPRNDAEEYQRFLEAAKKAEASDDPKDFERAFKRIVPPLKRPKPA